MRTFIVFAEAGWQGFHSVFITKACAQAFVQRLIEDGKPDAHYEEVFVLDSFVQDPKEFR